MAAALPGKNVEWVTEPDAVFPIRMGESGTTALEPETIPEAFARRASATPDRVAFKQKVDGEWQETTWSEYYEQARCAARAMLSLGLEQFGAVSVLGFNSPQWFLADMGSVMCGAKPAGIYGTNSPKASAYIINHSNAKIVFVDGAKSAARILAVRDECPGVAAIVQWGADEVDADAGVMSWEAFMALGSEVDDAALDERMAQIVPGHCAQLIYTSGTTGNPKAVMVSHDNLVWTAKATFELISTVEDEHLVSFLPLSHIAAVMLDVIGPLVTGSTIWFAQPDALKGSLGATLTEAQPTIFLGVPRVWEKIQAKIEGVIAAKMKAAAEAGVAPQPLPAGAVAQMLGLGRCHYASTAAAPISTKTLQFFEKLGITIYEIYGMSECTGPQTVSLPGQYEFGTTGPSMEVTELKIDNPDEDGNGEICYKGRHIMMGYMGNDEVTAQTIDEDGFLHSGDIGRVEESGFLRITGRKKELLVTAGGENVPPVYIESCLKEALPFISNAVCIGDKRKFLSCLFTIGCVIDPNTGQPTDTLSDGAARAIAALGSEATSVPEAIADPAISDAIQAAVDNYNDTQSISRAQQVRKWTFLPADLSIPGGELGPTMKLKRRIVTQKYDDVIEGLYAE